MAPTKVTYRVQTTPAEPRVGDELTLHVTIDCADAIDADAIEFELAGVERSKGSTVDHLLGIASTTHHPVLRETISVNGLRQGENRFDLRGRLPRDAPPSFDNRRATTEWVARVRVSIDWAIDLRWSQAITVLPPRDAQAPAELRYFAWAERDADPMIECALSSTALEPNEEVQLAFAVTRAPRREILQVDLTLVSVHTPYSNAVTEPKELAYWCLHRGRFASGVTLTRAVRVPSDARPSFNERGSMLEHQFVLSVIPEEGETCVRKIPCRIVARGDERAERVLEPVGAERLERVWMQIEREAKLRDANGARVDRTGLHGSFAIGAANVHIAQKRHEQLGVATQVVVRYPSLGAGLSISPRLRPTGNAAPAVYTVDFWRRFECSSREPAQIEAALSIAFQQWAQWLIGLTASDDELSFWCPAVTMSLSAIPSLFVTIDGLAAELARFDERVRPPQQLTHIAESNRAFAAEKSAQLRGADLRVHGWALHGRLVSISYVFEGSRPVGTRVHVQDAGLSDEQVRSLSARHNNGVSVSDGALTLALSTVSAARELEATASKFVHEIIEMQQKARGAYR